MLALFLLLIAAHFVADYSLQSEFMALNKARKGPLGAIFWENCLVAHAATHGAAVALAVSLMRPDLAIPLGIAETMAHGLIDFGKCEGKYGSDPKRSLMIDQALHIGCKLAWVIAFAATTSGDGIIAGVVGAALWVLIPIGIGILMRLAYAAGRSDEAATMKTIPANVAAE